MKKYLYYKKIENHYPLLNVGNKYFCKKDLYKNVKVQLEYYTTTYYSLELELFNNHFMSIKELRLQKLKKLSELC